MNRNRFSFYVILPVCQGLVFAFSQSGSEPLRGVSGYLAYWLISSFVAWQLLALGSMIASSFLKPFGASLTLVLIIGFAIGITLWMPVSDVRDILLNQFTEDGQSIQGYSRFSDLAVTISNWSMAVANWLLANYLFLYAFGMPRFGYHPDSKKVAEFRSRFFPSDEISTDQSDTKPNNAYNESNGNTQPDLSKRLKSEHTGPILVLVAEDHYTRVITADQEELIYLRFSDAIKEMQNQKGFQTHRSYWVSADAACGYSEKGHLAFVHLSNGDSIPVSRSFRQTVKQQLVSAQIA